MNVMAATTPAPQAALTSTRSTSPSPRTGLRLKTCLIRPYHASDVAAIAHAGNNPLIAKFMRNSFPSPYGLKDAETWVQICLNNNPGYDFCIADPTTDGLIGSIGLKPTPSNDIDALNWEVGYWLGQEHWGKGIVKEALVAMVNWAFGEIKVTTSDGVEWGLQRLQALVYEGNEASMGMLRKVGFVLEGVNRKAVIKNGIVLDMHVWAMTRGDWDGLESNSA